MSCLFLRSSCGAILSKTTQLIPKASSTPRYLHPCSFSPWKTSRPSAGVLASLRVQVQCYSRKSSKSKSGSAKLGSKDVLGDEKDAFFVVRKGDLIGVYGSLSDCQAQVGSSIRDPPVSLFKGYRMSKETEEYLASSGLKGADYTIRAADLKDDMFGVLSACTLEVPVLGEPPIKVLPWKKYSDSEGSDTADKVASKTVLSVPERENSDQEASPVSQKSCKLEFDGASKGNPGEAGAGAVLRAEDGTVICRLREGLGKATNNEAEYRAMILGLKYALKKGYTSIHIQGDSKLICMQINEAWKTRAENMDELCKEAKKLKAKFSEFKVDHVLRGKNSEADAQANLAIKLADGQVEEVYD